MNDNYWKKKKKKEKKKKERKREQDGKLLGRTRKQENGNSDLCQTFSI